MKKNSRYKPAALLILFLTTVPLSAGHRGAVTSLIHNGDTIISGAEDGFIVIWNMRNESRGERFQLTPYQIKAIVKHPLRNEIAVIESDEIDNYRISAWNYRNRERLFSIQSEEPVTFINYSTGGSYIIAAGLDGPHLTLLDSVTGRIISTIDIPSGGVTLGITGRSERNMLLYQPENEYFEGQIIYLDLESQSVSSSFQAPVRLLNPIIFGNNRFIAGINSDGLVVVDAATGSVLAEMEDIGRNPMLYPAGNEFYCLSREGNIFLYRFTVDHNGNLVTRQRLALSDNIDRISAFAYNTNAVFADANGNLYLVGQQGRIVPMVYNFQTRITEIAVSQINIAALTEDSELFFLPLNFHLFENMRTLTIENKRGYARITSISAREDFILWQNINTQYTPRIVSSDYQIHELGFNLLPGRFPVRSISSKNNNILILDSAGNIYVYNTENPSARANFTFSSIGAIDAVIVDNNYFLLCRSVVGRNSPFLFVNFNTGETVPVSFPAEAGIMAYAGKAGNVYAAVVERDITGVKTTVYAIASPTTTASAVRLFEYPGEGLNLSIAESSGTAAIAIGSEGARIYPENIINFERTEGLPVKLRGSDEFFLVLDSEGNISWHDNKSGKLLAVFRLYEDRWVLDGDREISGRLLRQ